MDAAHKREPPQGATDNLMNNHLRKLYHSKILCDLCINLGGKIYNIHKVALTSHSEKYFNMFGDAAAPVSEIVLEDVSPEVVERVLEYLYTSDIDIREDSVDDIMSICDQLDLKVLKERCSQFLHHFNEKNVFHLLRLSRRHGLKNLTRKMQYFVAENIDTIRLDSHFGLLDFADVYAILKSDVAHDRIKSQKYLLRIGITWLKSGKPSDDRQPFAATVFECIELEKVHPKEICKQINAVPFILNNSECITILRKAFRYHACLARNNCEHSNNNDAKNESSNIPNPLNDGSQSIVVIGGVVDTSESLEYGDQVLKFSLSSSKWNKLPSLLTKRSGHGSAFINGSLYVIGGYIHLASSSIPKPTEMVDCYDDKLARWQCVSSMSVKRAMFALAALEDGHIYVFGGETEGFRPVDSCECYLVKADQWTTIAPLSVGRIGASACQFNGLIYVVGGIIEEIVLPYVECYDFGLKRWSSRCPLPQGRCYGSLVQNSFNLLYIGGVDADKYSSKVRSEATILEYNVVSDSWFERYRLPNTRHYLSTTVVGDKVFVIGGFSTEYWEYFDEVICFNGKSFHMDMTSVTPFAFGLMKAAAVGINPSLKEKL